VPMADKGPGPSKVLESDDAVGALGVAGKTHYEQLNAWPRKRWHALGATLFPSEMELFEADSLQQLIKEWVIPGWAPKEPLLAVDDSVFTLGSCFARELLRYLTKAGVSSKRLWIPSGLNNSFAILDFFSWCATGEETGRGFRYDRLETGEIIEWKPEAERQAYADEFAKAGAFVFTFGLAEVWEDRETGGVFWRGVPEEIFDADRHRFRLTTVEENAVNIRRIVELCGQLNPTAPVVLTLSPVPLMATFRDVSCMTADCVSKSVLRVALDQVMSDGREGVYYWPSYEVVRWAGAHVPWPAYGLHNRKPRDVSKRIVAEIIDAFVEAYYTPEAVARLRTTGGGRPTGRSEAARGAPWEVSSAAGRDRLTANFGRAMISARARKLARQIRGS
jgi:GSCFA family